MLEVGHHITYMPKDKGTLYVGYTRYPNLPKTQEGYIRQGKDVEDDFILFKKGLGEEKKVVKKYQQNKPSSFLYYVAPLQFLNYIIKEGIKPQNGAYFQLYENEQTALEKTKQVGEFNLLRIDATKMYEDGYIFYTDDNGSWYIEEIPKEYISRISHGKDLD